MKKNQSKYDPEDYWSIVGTRIRKRENGENIIAGDDEPYYRYKRKEFLKLLTEIDFSGKSVLEIGCGPGGNLIELKKLKPSKLIGVDISNEMVSLAKRKVSPDVEVIKVDGKTLPFEDNSFEIVFTATVLQHNTDENMLRGVMNELARVSSDKVYLFERIEKTIKGNELCLGRPESYYSEIMYQNGFLFTSRKNINILISFYLCGAIRKFLNPRTRKEGEPLNRISVLLQKLVLSISKNFDKIIKSNRDLARLEYLKK